MEKNETTHEIYQRPSIQFTVGVILCLTFLVNLSSLLYIFRRLKLSIYIKKILIALQISNISVTIIMLFGLFAISIQVSVMLVPNFFLLFKKIQIGFFMQKSKVRNVHKFQDKNQWSYGLLCDTSIVFFHNSFLYSHLISRVRFHMAERTSKQQSINLRRIGNWTRIGFGKYILRPNSPAFK